MSEVKMIRNEQVRTLVIECPARCAAKGCAEHAGQEWRTSTRLAADTPIDYARVLLERHAAAYPTSGPYRLVERVTTHTETVEVIEP